MAITTLTYEAPIRRSASRREQPDYELLETAVALHDEGRHLESLTKTLEHLFPGEKLPNLATEGYKFTQGSSRVSTRIEGDDVVVTVPMVRLPAGGSAIAALRFVLTKISCTGQLFQPRLRGEEIHLEFRDRLTRLHPAKMVEVLRRMPAEADENDDWLIGQFGAQPLERAETKPIDDGEFKRAEAIWRTHWAEVEELVKECQRKRSIFFLNETTSYALYRILFVLPLGGFLLARLEEAASTFNDSNEDPLKREAALTKCAKEMKGIAAEELRKSLFHADYAMSPHDDGTPAVLDNYIGEGDYTDTIKQLRTSGKSFEAALALVSTYNYMLSRFSWPEEIEIELKQGLEKVSGKPWREIATVLAEHAKELAAKYESDDDDEDEDEEGDEEGDEEEEEEEDDEEEEEEDE